MKIDAGGVLVTGAGSGLGAATARLMSERGAPVVLADVDPVAESLAERLSGPAIFVRTDVRDESDVAAAIAAAVARFDTLRVVVNCAGGGGVPGKVVDREGRPMELAAFTSKVELNLFGTFNVIRLAAATMRAQPAVDDERGVIVNTASIAAFEGQIGQVAYAAAKGAVVSMTLPLARELAADRIRVVTVAPGFFETPRTASFPETARQRLLANCMHPARGGKPEEFASFVAHAVENQMLNGTTIRLDGAVRMPPR